MFTLRKHAHASVKHGTRFTIHFRIEGPLVFRVSLFRLDQSIGLAPTLKDGIWDLYYCRFRIGQLDQHNHQITYGRRLVETRSARFNQTPETGKPATKQ